MARLIDFARSLKAFPSVLRPAVPAVAGAAVLALSTGCCCTGGGYGSYYGGGGNCDTGQCGSPYGAGYGAPVYPQGAMAAPAGPVAAAPVYYQTQTAAAPVIYQAAPTQTAAAPVNCVPTY